MTLACPVEKPLGYIVLFSENGAVIGRHVVDGKVTSLNSYLSPDSEYFEISSEYTRYRVFPHGVQQRLLRRPGDRADS